MITYNITNRINIVCYICSSYLGKRIGQVFLLLSINTSKSLYNSSEFVTETQKQLFLKKMESAPTKLLLFIFIINYYSFPATSTNYSISPIPNEALPTKSGYLQVNSTTKSAMFYTFYEAKEPNSSLSDTPILIWLQGGPGCSSMLGNFYELGPWRVVSSQGHNVEHLKLEPNSGSWNRLFGLVFIDNPIGAGFSIARTMQEIPKDQHAVGKHLFKAIKAFIALDSMFKSRPIYVTGESYAGKYVPAIGYYILKRNARLVKSSRVNLAGVAIGNGLTDRS